MARIYISSTYEDLKDYREAAYRALRRLRHDVVAMEDYVAADERPLALLQEGPMFFTWRGDEPHAPRHSHFGVTSDSRQARRDPLSA